MTDIGWTIVQKRKEKRNKHIDTGYVKESFLGMHIRYSNLSQDEFRYYAVKKEMKNYYIS